MECRVAEFTGIPHEQIVLEAQRYDLVLLGQPTDSDLGLGEPFHKTVGSVLKSSPRPAVVVPENYREGNGILHRGKIPLGRYARVTDCNRSRVFKQRTANER